MDEFDPITELQEKYTESCAPYSGAKLGLQPISSEVGTGAICLRAEPSYAYRRGNPCKESCNRTEGDWVAMAADSEAKLALSRSPDYKHTNLAPFFLALDLTAPLLFLGSKSWKSMLFLGSKSWKSMLFLGSKSWKSMLFLGSKSWKSMLFLGSKSWKSMLFLGSKSWKSMLFLGSKSWKSMLFLGSKSWKSMLFLGSKSWKSMLFLGSKSWKSMLFLGSKSWKSMLFVRNGTVLLTPEQPSKKTLPVKRTLKMKRSMKRAEVVESSGRPNKPMIVPRADVHPMMVKGGENGAAPECKGEGNGRSRENPPTNSIVRYDSHLRKSGVTRPGIEPGSPWWEASSLTTQDYGEGITKRGSQGGDEDEPFPDSGSLAEATGHGHGTIVSSFPAAGYPLPFSLFIAPTLSATRSNGRHY
ncbi:hypothetical protein PR048_024285 [Dryococelus australis]|uniref:Uncharacterized protein n=1 Tax=Dryococelus australis TaxID=614101 RepID=A0ABQ9GN63_9NEOP|nr:hypothetical protein PR048_024285 [Dryococelus australis]